MIVRYVTRVKPIWFPVVFGEMLLFFSEIGYSRPPVTLELLLIRATMIKTDLFHS